MKDKDSKAHFIHFLEKLFIIAIVLFIIIQIGGGIIINATVPKEQQESFEKYQEDYIGHWYDGTFFINMTVDENYGSQEQYQKMLNDYHSNPRQDIYFYIAKNQAGRKNKKEAIDAIEKMLFHAHSYDLLPPGEKHYTSKFINATTSNIANTSKNYSGSNICLVLNLMNQKEFDFIRNDSDYLALIKKYQCNG